MYSRTILYLLSLYIFGTSRDAGHLSDDRCLDFNSRTSFIYCWYYGPCYRQLCRVFHSQVLHEAMVHMDLLYQSGKPSTI